MVVDDKSQASILTQCVWKNQFILVGKQSLYTAKPYTRQDCVTFINKSGETLQFEFWNEKGVPKLLAKIVGYCALCEKRMEVYI